MQLPLADEAATVELGYAIAQLCPQHAFAIHLEGELGAGKTTFTRGFLTGLGHQGHVKSPTYTLVEQYQLSGQTIYHFDLYRLADPEELDYIGLDDYLGSDAISLIEWPAQGGHYLPVPDLRLKLDYQAQGRVATIDPESEQAQALYNALKKAYSTNPSA